MKNLIKMGLIIHDNLLRKITKNGEKVKQNQLITLMY